MNRIYSIKRRIGDQKEKKMNAALESKSKSNQNNFIIVSILSPCTSAVLIGETEDRIGIWKCWFLSRGENRSKRRKTSRSKDENKQQTQPTYDTGTSSRTQATLVGGECSHHCAIPAPQIICTAFIHDSAEFNRSIIRLNCWTSQTKKHV